MRQTDVESVKRDVEETLGRVPTWMDEAVPESHVASLWDEFKNFQMSPDTKIPPKYKELIGLAVSAQIPCQYCVLFHTEAAKLHGATNEEIQEAIFQASLTRQFSTILNGWGQDFEEFRQETQRIVEHVRRAQPQARSAGRR